ncbi:MAG: motility associated factor glycosyltransferase family protein, partial [Deltaproteobacteria bacterium]|nr:motility associated factor glycosyltransferase family protein [Deltaproteobacteria bacterium]
MARNAIFDRNLLVLGTRNKNLASRCAYADDYLEYRTIISKTEKNVPAIKSNGRVIPFHSRFDPVKEGNRFPEIYKSRGFLLFFGFGGAYHISPFLKDKSIEKILIIDKDINLFSSIVKNIDLRHVFLDERVSLLIEEDMDYIRNYLLSVYLPIITGDLQTIILRPAVQLDTDYFNRVSDLIREVLEQVGDDFTVQTRFGKKWFRNTVANLGKAENAAFKIGSIRKAFITAAGPSLDEHIDKLLEIRDDVFLIATDTSLSALLHRNIKPDLVISIDCQD